MYAIIATGGKQYRAAVGNLIDVEKLDGEVGDEVTLEDVRLYADDDGNVKVGSPTLENASVKCKILRQEKNKKIIVFKSKKRKHSKTKNGHRQFYTRLQIEAINV
ncbi:MAG: 50S ribosomal protein L21 [Candidatus Poribacteria bacterium]|nr:50S ribosomal protein L21 [Candidatus Poribacteria bacterium]